MKTPFLGKFRRLAVMAIIALIAGVSPASAAKYASIVVDMDTAQVLHARNADDQRYPASLTKVMTLYMLFDAVKAGEIKLSERFPVSKHAAAQAPSKLGLKAGATIKCEDAIRALVTKSANDVAVVVAERLAGTESKFARTMTAKAKELGLENTVYKNASGLPDPGQITTARDLAKLAEAVYRDHREYYAYFSTPDFVWAKRHNKNHNALLAKVNGVDGIKTGYTNASGYNLMASAERDGRRVVAVMLGGATGKARDAHVADLLEAAFVHIKGDTEGESLLASRIDAGERNNSSADELAAAQLRRFSEQPATDEATAENVSFSPDETTDEGEDDAAQGDAAAADLN